MPPAAAVRFPDRGRGRPKRSCLGVTYHRSCCHARVPERYRIGRYDRSHLVIVLPSAAARNPRATCPFRAWPAPFVRPAEISAYACRPGLIRPVIAGSVSAASRPGKGGIIRAGSPGPASFRRPGLVLTHSLPVGSGQGPQRLLSDLPCYCWRLVFLREVPAWRGGGRSVLRMICREARPWSGPFLSVR